MSYFKVFPTLTPPSETQQRPQMSTRNSRRHLKIRTMPSDRFLAAPVLPPEWTRRARCLGRWDLFDSDVGTTKEEMAFGLCETCPVKATCLLDAIASDDAYGIRGGIRMSAAPGRKRKRKGITVVSSEAREAAKKRAIEKQSRRVTCKNGHDWATHKVPRGGEGSEHRFRCGKCKNEQKKLKKRAA